MPLASLTTYTAENSQRIIAETESCVKYIANYTFKIKSKTVI